MGASAVSPSVAHGARDGSMGDGSPVPGGGETEDALSIIGDAGEILRLIVTSK